jgi:hypothetical protein
MFQATTLTQLRMKNNTPSRFLKQDDIERIVFIFENYPAAEFEAELRKAYEQKCDICEVERDLETGECDCRLVACSACGDEHPKYELNLVEGCFGLRCDECDPTQHTSCYECGECLDDPATHLFCFSKEGEKDRTMCGECGQDFHKEYKSDGWTRDDDSEEDSDSDDDSEEDSDSDDDSEGDSESDAETEGECHDGSVWVCCKCEKVSDGKGFPDSKSQFYEELGDWYCGKCHEYYTREDQDDFTNRICEWCHLDFDLADPHYYDEEGNCCYCSEECFKKEQDWLSAPPSTRPAHGSIRTSPTRDQLIALGKYKLAKFQIGKREQKDETNWNEDGDDELCSAIDASGNALY